MRRAILFVTLLSLSGVVLAQVAPVNGTYGPYGPTGNQFYSRYSGSAVVSPSFAQPIDWMRVISRNDVWDDNSQNGPTAWITSGPPRHRAATYAHYPNFPNVSPSRAMVDPLPADRVTAPPATPYRDPFFEEHFWEDLEADRDISDLWGW